MNIDLIIEKFRSREPKLLENRREYAVMLPLIEIEGKWHIIFERRANNLNTDPGEVSFPGGGVEEGESFEEAAIRETIEELKIAKENIHIFGPMDILISHSNFIIQPFVGMISGVDFDNIQPNDDEVQYIFTVPMEFFFENDPERYHLDLQTVGNDDFPYYLLPNGKEYNFKRGRRSVLFYRYLNEIIWGYTAMMTRNFIDIIKDLD